MAAAAVSGLGMLATPKSIASVQQVLANKPSLRVAAADACLTAADRLLAEGKNADALIVLGTLRKTALPKHLNVASRLGEIRAGSQDVNELMNNYLRDDDPDLFRIGLELAHHLTDAKTTGQLLKQLDALTTKRQVLLMHVLGDRGGTVHAVVASASHGAGRRAP